MIYDVDYFILKFKAIPEELWCVGSQFNYKGQSCAWGHCNGDRTDEGIALEKILSSIQGLTLIDDFVSFDMIENPYKGTPARINNGDVKQYQQPTPKQRILAALYDLKKLQQPAVKERTVYVTVDQPVRELQKNVELKTLLN